MAFKYATGPLGNLVGRGLAHGSGGTAGVTVEAGTVDPSYPLTNLYNGIPALPVRFSDNLAAYAVKICHNIIPNGDMEQYASTTLASWTALGTVTREGTTTYKGSSSMKVVTGTSGIGASSPVITVQSGEYLRLKAALYGDGTYSAAVAVQCLETGLYLQSNGTWGSLASCLSQTAASWSAQSLDFQAPPMSATGKTTVSLVINLGSNSSARTVYFDEVLLIPGFNFVGVLGYPAPGTMQLYGLGTNYWHSPSESAINWTGASANASMLLPSVYAQPDVGMVYEPITSLHFTPNTTPTAGYWLGELVYGQMKAFPREPQSLSLATSSVGQQRSTTRGGTSWVYNANAYPLKQLRVTLQNPTDAERVAEEAEFIRLCESGRWPIVVFPQTLAADLMLYGRVAETMSFQYDFAQKMINTTEVLITEEPLPNM